MKRPAILVMWHESIALPIGLGFHSPVALLVSQHRDANWLNMAAEGMGFDIVRGSTTRGGGAALRRLKELSQTHSMVITPDGPKGPRRVMNMGAVYLASLLQLPIVPVGVGLRDPWRLNTWDRFAIPKPGQRARIIFGPTIDVPRRCGRELLEKYATAIGSDLDQINQVADHWAMGNYEYVGNRRLNLWGHWVPVQTARQTLPLPDLNSHVQQLQQTGSGNESETHGGSPADGSLKSVA
jgi:lysophospholipid acyltransferase (LPLAT)-like uncharacterized protein